MDILFVKGSSNPHNLAYWVIQRNMSIKPFLKLMMNRQLLALTGIDALLKPFYQLSYLVAAKKCGPFELLLDAPKSLNRVDVRRGEARSGLIHRAFNALSLC